MGITTIHRTTTQAVVTMDPTGGTTSGHVTNKSKTMSTHSVETFLPVSRSRAWHYTENKNLIAYLRGINDTYTHALNKKGTDG